MILNVRCDDDDDDTLTSFTRTQNKENVGSFLRKHTYIQTRLEIKKASRNVYIKKEA